MGVNVVSRADRPTKWFTSNSVSKTLLDSLHVKALFGGKKIGCLHAAYICGCVAVVHESFTEQLRVVLAFWTWRPSLHLHRDKRLHRPFRNTRSTTYTRPWPLPSKSFPINCSSVILPSTLCILRDWGCGTRLHLAPRLRLCGAVLLLRPCTLMSCTNMY